MPVKVLKDGQMVDRGGDDASIGPTDRSVSLGYTTIHTKGTVLRDEEVSSALLEIVKASGHPGLAYFDSEEEAEDTPQDNEALLDELEETQRKLAEAQEAAAELETTRDDLIKELDEAKSRIQDLEAELDEATKPEPEAEGQSGDAEVGSPAAGGSTEKSDTPPYDPDEHNQAQVLAHLKDADAAEVARVQEVEARGQNRQQIAQFKAAGE